MHLSGFFDLPRIDKSSAIRLQLSALSLSYCNMNNELLTNCSFHWSAGILLHVPASSCAILVPAGCVLASGPCLLAGAPDVLKQT